MRTKSKSQMKYAALILVSVTLTSLTLFSPTRTKLIDRKWIFQEASTQRNSSLKKFSSAAKASETKSTLLFKENGILVEMHKADLSNPYFISDWQIVSGHGKEILKISNSRQWSGAYQIVAISQQQLQLKKLK